MAVVAMLFTACNEKKTDEHGHEHTDGTHEHADGETAEVIGAGVSLQANQYRNGGTN